MKIDRRKFIKTSALGALSLPLVDIDCFADRLQSTDGVARPNILLLITDQHHYNAFSCRGNQYVKTPNLDKIISGGISFSNAYCTSPVCIPTRSSLFTGRMPSETGNWFNSARSGNIEPGMPTLGRWLNEKGGYESVYAGKWHVPQCHTFDIDGFKVLSAGQNHWGDVSDTMASTACANYIYAKEDSKPFFMVCSLIQPHDICMWLSINTANQDKLRYEQIADELPPLPENFNYDELESQFLKDLRKSQQPSEGSWQELQWRYYFWNYYRHVEMVDSEIGRVLDSIEDTARMDNTIIIHLADHGEGMGEHQMVRKGYLYDASAKIPLSFYGPDFFEGSRVDDNLASHLDVFPTLCQILDIDVPDDVCGTSLYPLLKNNIKHWKRNNGDFVVAEEGANGKGIKGTARMVRSTRYKYVKYYGSDVEQLFDMVDDPGETINLAKEAFSREIIERHRDMLRGWENNLVYAPRLQKKAVDKWKYL